MCKRSLYEIVCRNIKEYINTNKHEDSATLNNVMKDLKTYH